VSSWGGGSHYCYSRVIRERTFGNRMLHLSMRGFEVDRGNPALLSLKERESCSLAYDYLKGGMR